MRPHIAEERLRERVASSGISLAALTPLAGVELMLCFYRDERAEGCCPFEHDGDMVLYQWGTYDWGQGPAFVFDITRQFITPVGDDGDIEQLSLTFKYPPTPSNDALGKGNRWCQTPQDLPTFREFVEKSPPHLMLGQSRAEAVTITFGCA